MNPAPPASLSPKADQLRQAFDATFAVPPPPPAPPVRVFLLVRVAGELFALQRDRLAGIARGQAVARAPGKSRAFLGLVEAQHRFHPVWSLAGLLGREMSPRVETAWLLLAEIAGANCAFACEAVEQMIFTPESDLVPPARPGEPARARTAGGLVPIIELAALHAEILQRNPSPSTRPAP
jgi:chemotaxis signal transduction protein